VKRLVQVLLWVADPQALATFYVDVLGLSLVSHDPVTLWYGGQDARLVLLPADAGSVYAAGDSDRYWKIAISLPDLDVACAQLRARGVACSGPTQFREIAYLSHLRDPDGHVVELLQHTFDGGPKSLGDPSSPLGGGARLNLVTLRTHDLDAEQRRCRALGLRLLSRQAVSDRGFDLYFYAGLGDTPPDPDVDAVVNRPWVWKRPYTVLEFQHRLTTVVGAPVREGQVGSVRLEFQDAEGRLQLYV
jgi:catechol 2,3-dioxygenase-like lactoylglutathione lyase family enzyme